MNKPIIAIEYSTGRRIHYPSAKVASEELGIDRASISTVLNNKQKLTKGWRFIFDTPEYEFDGAK